MCEESCSLPSHHQGRTNTFAVLPPSGLPTHDSSDLLNVKVRLAVFRLCAPPGQVFVLVEVLEEGWLTDELLLLAHPLAGASGLCQPDLQSAEGWPHHLSMAKVLRNHTRKTPFLTPAAAEEHVTNSLLVRH